MYKLEIFSQYLDNRLKTGLPGLESHLKMTPLNDGKPIRKIVPNPDARVSSVMILLTESNGAIQVLFTLRSRHLGSHSGQISFPGGMTESEETAAQTALREVYEEIAIHESQINLIGNLSQLFVPPSNSIINPIIGTFNHSKVSIIPSPDEVEEVFFVDILDFYNPEKFKREMWNIQGYLCDVPFWDIHSSTPLWGATSMILREFLDISHSFFFPEVQNVS